MAELADRRLTLIGVDNCLGSGPEGLRQKDYHAAAVADGGGTLAGLLHQSVLACGYGDAVKLLIADSVSAAQLFADESLQWVHLDARHDYDSVVADIAAWLPKVCNGGWLSGDDYDPVKWPGVVAAVSDSVPAAGPWLTGQWRLVVV